MHIRELYLETRWLELRLLPEDATGYLRDCVPVMFLKFKVGGLQ